MPEDQTRLVLRRVTGDKGNKITVTLDPGVARDANLYELLCEGITIELLDVEPTSNEGQSVVTMGLRADNAFKIDREEAVARPREDRELGRMEPVWLSRMAVEELEKMSIDALQSRVLKLVDSQATVDAYLRTMKSDKAKGAERGFHHKDNRNHTRWHVICDELDTLKSQTEFLKTEIRKTDKILKRKRQAESESNRASFQDLFFKTVEGKVSPEEMKALIDQTNKQLGRESDSKESGKPNPSAKKMAASR